MIFHLTSLWWLCLLCPSAYLIGNFNCTRFLCKYVFHDEQKIATVGSGNPGATNMLRMHGSKWFFIVFFADTGKGVLSALLGAVCYGYTEPVALVAMLSCGIAVAIGTIYPVFYKFHGGKAVATMVGVAWFINPVILSLLFLVYLVLILTVRIISILSITGLSFWVVLSIYLKNEFFFPVREIDLTATILYCVFIVLVLWTHRKNIVRICKWQEKRVSFGKKKS